MKKNLYYRNVISRESTILNAFYDFFLIICSTPRMLLEVFIRKNFGERYFSFSKAIITALFLAVIPFVQYSTYRSIGGYGGGRFDIFVFLFKYLTWYCFLAGFIAMSIDRRSEIKRLPSAFDFGRFSKSSGTLHPKFINYQLFGKPVTTRQIETLIEPAFFFIIGFGLAILDQPIGPILILCSICYSISYFGAYHYGDKFILDKIDEMIFNQNLTKSFIEGRVPNETQGVNYYGRKPADPEMRRRLAESFLTDDPDIIEAR